MLAPSARSRAVAAFLSVANFEDQLHAHRIAEVAAKCLPVGLESGQPLLNGAAAVRVIQGMEDLTLGILEFLCESGVIEALEIPAFPVHDYGLQLTFIQKAGAVCRFPF